MARYAKLKGDLVAKIPVCADIPVCPLEIRANARTMRTGCVPLDACSWSADETIEAGSQGHQDE
jgi:hypothetical protein